jgi:hypothetical protein
MKLFIAIIFVVKLSVTPKDVKKTFNIIVVINVVGELLLLISFVELDLWSSNSV